MPLMAPQQNLWVNPQSQFSNAAQGYTTHTPVINTAGFRSSLNQQPSSSSSSSGGSFMSPSNISSFKSIGQFASNGFQLPQSSFLNNIGSSLGFASGSPTGLIYSGGALPWQAAGSAAPSWAAGASNVASSAGSLSASSLSSTLGAAGIGALAGGFLGRIGGNSTGGSIGGGLGAAVGNAVLPGVGGLIGGALGGIVGGFFGGKKKPNPASNFSATLTSNGGTTNTVYGSKHLGDDVAKGIEQGLSQYLQQQAKKYNVKFADGLSFGGGYDPGMYGNGGGRIMSGNKENTTTIDYDPNNPDSTKDMYNKVFNNLARMSGYDPDTFSSASNAANAPAGVLIKQGTQGSFNEFMKSYQGGTNVQSPTPES